MYFYDTCALLNMGETAFDEPFLVSDVTMQELENIKNDTRRDSSVRYRARKTAKLLDT